MHFFFHLLVISKLVSSLSIPEWTKCVIILWLYAECCNTLKFIYWWVSMVWMAIVMQQCNTLHYHLSAFYSGCWFWLVPECLIVMEFSAVSLCRTLLVNFWLLLVDQHLIPSDFVLLKVYNWFLLLTHLRAKKYHIMLLFFGADGKWSIHINYVVMILQLQFNIWTSQQCWEFMCVLAFTISSITNTKEI